ncbi:glycosyltransferase family 4 protein [Desulfosarcina ovata]|uniref:glycosyltransferase family 4 protein n=1 Tax=Desulfosarcina ovata TaxID=83564 RepID=UPI0012D2C778|nr:MraY family glycosyltransferase [Desulfosarcina ovata]
MLYLSAFIIALFLTISIMPLARLVTVKINAVDKPNKRKVHDHVVPKCGGIAMAVGIFMPILFWQPFNRFTIGFLIGCLIICVFGVLDDIYNLNPYHKLIAQVSAALTAVLVSGVKIFALGSLIPSTIILPDILSIPLTLIVIVGVTNSTNLSDGLDGLAGGMNLLTLLCVSYLGFLVHDYSILMIAVVSIGAILGFLRFNSFPAQLFMGDCGSQMLGFIGIVISIKLTQQYSMFSPFLPLIFFGLPVIDTVYVMIKRIVEGRHPFRADNNHFHHRLLSFGLYHREAVFVLYVIQALFVSVSIVLYMLNDFTIIIAYFLSVAAIIMAITVLASRDYKIQRDKYLDRIKAKLRPLKERGIIIIHSHRFIKFGLPLLLFVQICICFPIAEYYLVYIFLAGFIIFSYLFNNFIVLVDSFAFRMFFYFFVPFLILNSNNRLFLHSNNVIIIMLNLFYLIFLTGIFLTIQLTRRANGFKFSNLDFLIIFLFVLIPLLPEFGMDKYLLVQTVTETVIVYYGYEVLSKERRKGNHLETKRASSIAEKRA